MVDRPKNEQKKNFEMTQGEQNCFKFKAISILQCPTRAE